MGNSSLSPVTFKYSVFFPKKTDKKVTPLSTARPVMVETQTVDNF